MKTSYTITPSVRNDYLVRERDRRRYRELFWMSVVALVAVAPLMAYTSLHHQLRQAGLRIDRSERQLTELRNEERRLQLHVARISSPDRLEERAVRELGLAPPTIDQLVFVELEEGP